MTRQLVTFRWVTDVVPIEGADAIELAKIDGWQCVVKKGDFAPGDTGVYHEIDSLLPLDNPAYSFLQRPGATKTHHRLKTIKLRGALSQGLLLRLSDPGLEVARSWVEFGPETEVPDLAAELHVLKYEPPQPGEPGTPGVRLKTFPGFLPRTDLERVQNLSQAVALILADTYSPEQFEVQAKYDGTSITAYYLPEDCKSGVCSRNQELQLIPSNMYWQAAYAAGWLEALPIIARACGGTVAIQGELMGPKIQSNRMKLENRQAFAFDIFSVSHARYLTRTERDLMWGLVKFQCGAEIAEVDTVAPVWHLSPISEILVDFMAECESSVDYPLEGVVYKSHKPGGLRFKALSNSYLLKYNE